MKIVVLLSAGRHPMSGRPAPVGVEMQAIRLGCDLGAAPVGLHVGDDAHSVADALGYGLSHLELLQAGEAGAIDPLLPLTDHLRANPPDIILAGRRGQGGTDTGMLPYRLAHALGWVLLPDIVKLTASDGGIVAEQALPLGGRRILRAPSRVVATVHPAAPPAFAFRYAALRGEVRPVLGMRVPAGEPVELRPYRARPKVIEQAISGGRVLRGLSPEQAAGEILAELQRVGGAPGSTPPNNV